VVFLSIFLSAFLEDLAFLSDFAGAVLAAGAGAVLAAGAVCAIETVPKRTTPARTKLKFFILFEMFKWLISAAILLVLHEDIMKKIHFLGY
jgi:hypothetical protein